MVVTMTDLNEILRAWAADKEHVPRTQILEVDHEYDEGWGGTDVTPGDPGKFIIRYMVVREVMESVEIQDMGELISELADTLSRGPLTEVKPMKLPVGELIRLFNELYAELTKFKNNTMLTAEARVLLQRIAPFLGEDNG